MTVCARQCCQSEARRARSRQDALRARYHGWERLETVAREQHARYDLGELADRPLGENRRFAG